MGVHAIRTGGPGSAAFPPRWPREAIRIVESVQRSSAGVLAREPRIDIAASRLLLQAPESDGRLTRYPGMLPSGHDGAWLPGEEASEEPLVLWRLRYPEGKALAKADIGPAVPRSVTESLLAGFLDCRRQCLLHETFDLGAT